MLKQLYYLLVVFIAVVVVVAVVMVMCLAIRLYASHVVRGVVGLSQCVLPHMANGYHLGRSFAAADDSVHHG